MDLPGRISLLYTRILFVGVDQIIIEPERERGGGGGGENDGIFRYLHLLLHHCGLAAFVNSQVDSCSSNLNINGLPFDSASLHCVNAWSSQNFILRYAQTSSNLWSFVLSAPDANSYIAIGFSSNGLMIGSSAVVGWISATDGSSGVKNLPVDRRPAVAADNLCSRTDRFDAVFSKLLPDPHSSTASTALNYVTGQTSSLSPESKLRKSHGALSMAGWGILMMIGAIVARYFREWDPAWFYVHACAQSLGFLLGVAGVICGLVLEHRLGVDVSTHKGLGIFILVLGCLQVMAFLARPGKSSKVRKYWNWYHHSAGGILIVLAAANVFYGIHLARKGREWNVGMELFLPSCL
ncbi:cytochrome b561 and DOMON domain-containing protein [Salix suchowensis]|nr:cytochrome b561 and DOMON domain-containing protein [Salix suchowensis]